ncbi:hypothetical protein [Streptomyces sp. NRRL B-3648]|uniref:hypothetical protein n=1 Tax=Streptomyces sp. NRRL B-3648 TaxID=1519493 RepID=UPI0006ADEC53|nr:hypothetical protein [Streptomyces sp. NRRL B-3648]KOV96203.1 hypothetical protein ADL04_18800 [Streptomyces sp. NRRL B-3648]
MPGLAAGPAGLSCPFPRLLLAGPRPALLLLGLPQPLPQLADPFLRLAQPGTGILDRPCGCPGLLLPGAQLLLVYAAVAFEFVTPDAPHRADGPRRELDMASHAATRTVRDHPDDPESAWHREPKQAFHALARHYRDHSRHA